MKAVFFIRFALLLSLLGVCPAAVSAQPAPTILKPIPDGYTIIDGDIVMPKSVVEAILKGDTTVLNDATDGATNGGITWTNGVVPFEFQITNALPSDCPNAVPSGSVSAANQAAMISAMFALEQLAVLDFQQCAGASCPNGNRVLIRDSTNDVIRDSDDVCVSGARNSSPVGMRGGQQIINITSWTGASSQMIITHELMHTLGIYHEHMRIDRNNYVQIVCDNVQGGCQGTIANDNFKIKDTSILHGPYDFESVMHYGQCAFSIGMNCPADNLRTIVVQPPYAAQWQSNIGQRTHLSALDKESLGFLYPPPNWIFYDCTRNTLPQSGSFLHPYSQPLTAITATPPGGTLLVLKNCSFPVGTYNRSITIKTAPGARATFGN